jgi:hypothetical protein
MSEFDKDGNDDDYDNVDDDYDGGSTRIPTEI